MSRGGGCHSRLFPEVWLFVSVPHKFTSWDSDYVDVKGSWVTYVKTISRMLTVTEEMEETKSSEKKACFRAPAINIRCFFVCQCRRLSPLRIPRLSVGRKRHRNSIFIERTTISQLSTRSLCQWMFRHLDFQQIKRYANIVSHVISVLISPPTPLALPPPTTTAPKLGNITSMIKIQ